MRSPGQKFLVIYSGMLTLVFAFTVLSGFAGSHKKLDLQELDVQRINVREPDGTLRMVISDKARFPGLIVKNVDYPHPDRSTAGMLFFNDEGTENGGLIFGGYLGKDGKPVSYGHLSFDKYMQDQTLTLEASQNGSQYVKGLAIDDRPDYPITELFPLMAQVRKLAPAEREQAVNEFFKTHAKPAQRLYIGEGEGRDVSVALKDAEGRPRILLQVKPDGSAALEFLNAEGQVTCEIPSSDNKGCQG